MTRIHSLTSALSIWVYTDHAPPHFHFRSSQSDALVDMRTLQVMRGTFSRKDLGAVLAWAGDPANMAMIEAEWRRLNEQD